MTRLTIILHSQASNNLTAPLISAKCYAN